MQNPQRQFKSLISQRNREIPRQRRTNKNSMLHTRHNRTSTSTTRSIQPRKKLKTYK